VAGAVASLGGNLDAFYYALGESDLYAIADLPDNEAAVALSLTANTSDALVAETVALVTPEEMDAAARRSVDWRPPGNSPG
jgi:uncharacterized protein with GYD domain